MHVSNANSPDVDFYGVGSDLKLSLSCPECGAGGWVKMIDMRRGLRCRQCNCQFVLDRVGKPRAMAELPHVRYTCPRCKQTGLLPEKIAIYKAECAACKLPLVRGPDRRLRGNGEVRRMRQAAHAVGNSPPRFNAWLGKLLMTDDANRLKFRFALTCLVLIVLAGASWAAVGGMMGGSPESRAEAFTYECLAGDWDDALSYLSDDEVQQFEFERWRIRYFSSILDKYRPSGDAVHVQATTVHRTETSRILQVTMHSPFIGTRTMEQHWRLTEGIWQFDATATILANDRPKR